MNFTFLKYSKKIIHDENKNYRRIYSNILYFNL